MSGNGHSRTCAVRGPEDHRVTANFDSLTERQREILQATVTAWESNDPEPSYRPLRSAAGGGPGLHGNWPADVRDATDDELRPLAHTGWLFADRARAPDWVLSPTEQTLVAFQASGADVIADGLRDPDRRLGLILEAVVDAYAADPSEPVMLFEFDQGSVIHSDAWQLPPDVTRQHDFVLLEDIGLVRILRTADSIGIVPTGRGRDVVANFGQALDELIEESEDHATKTRLTRAKERITTLGSSAVSGTISGLVVKALMG